MLKFGQPPYLECSTKGDKKFSAFIASPKSLNGKSIEEAYQAAKIFEDGSRNLSWRKAKGRQAINQQQVIALYEQWWKEYILENDLLQLLKSAKGLSDIFGQKSHVCQAEVLWRIRNGEL